MTETAQEKAQRYATASAQRVEAQITRDWWRVTRPGGETFELFVPDRLTQAEVLARYPGCGVLPR